MSSPSLPLAPTADGSPSADLIRMISAEITAFKADCEFRYRFNSRWDNWLNAAGILLSVAIVAAGVYKQSELSAILGGLVAAIVTAQRAFPFGPRAQFYRVLLGQTSNLLTDIAIGAPLANTITTLKSLRLDFAQQLPRGNSTREAVPDGGDQPVVDDKAEKK